MSTKAQRLRVAELLDGLACQEKPSSIVPLITMQDVVGMRSYGLAVRAYNMAPGRHR